MTQTIQRRLFIRHVRSAAFLVLGFIAAAQVNGQDACDTDIVAFEGESGRSALVNGVETFELTRPILLQCDTELIAERGRREAEDRYRFEGNVRIVERGDTVYADNVLYFSDTKIGEANGHVRITDGRVLLSAPVAIYFTDEQRTVFNESVLFEDSTTVLKSRRGTYWSEDARAQFTVDVRLWQSSLYVEADSITYRRDTEETRARGNVYIERTEAQEIQNGVKPDTVRVSDPIGNTLFVFGDAVLHDSQRDVSLISGRVDMLQLERDSTGVDSLFVRSDNLSISRSEDADLVTATGDVSVLDGQLTVIGDSLIYKRVRHAEVDDVVTRMFGSPVAWFKQTQISADSLWLNGVNRKVDSLKAVGSVFVAEYDSTLGRIQQLKGRTLLGLFRDDSLRTMTVAPNAEALYYMVAESDAEQAAVHSTADRIVFLFERGSVVDVRSFDGIEGTFFPSNLIDQAENLEGFLWKPELRPALSEYRSEWNRRVQHHQSRKSR